MRLSEISKMWEAVLMNIPPGLNVADVLDSSFIVYAKSIHSVHPGDK